MLAELGSVEGKSHLSPENPSINDEPNSSYPYLLELLALDIHEQKRIPNMGEVRFGLQLAREVFV